MSAIKVLPVVEYIENTCDKRTPTFIQRFRVPIYTRRNPMN